MPRPSYYQSPGNPVQTQHLPAEPLQLEFAHQTGETISESSGTMLRNLYLISGISAAVDWLGWGLVDWMPFNLWIAGVVVFRLSALWKDRLSYRPHLAHFAIPYALHLLAISWELRVIVALATAAYVGREFARHFVSVNTTFPYTRETAQTIRDEWDVGTFFSVLLIIPVGVFLCVPGTFVLCGVCWVVGLVMSIAITNGNPAVAFENFWSAWHSWCNYNRHDHPAAGVLHSPAGTCSVRLGIVVLLVMQVSLLMARITSVPPVFIKQLAATSDIPQQPAWVGLGITLLLWAGWIAVPVIVSLMLIGLVAFPALIAFSGQPRKSRSVGNWQEITQSVRSSPNPIERQSLYLGRLACDGSPLLVPRTVFQEHAHILGDSGSGKTARGLIPLAEQLVADGESSLVVIDLKGDSQEILAALQIAATRTGRSTPIPLRYFSIREDQATYAFNIFQLPCWQRLNLFQRTDVLCGALGLVYGTDYGKGYFSSANAAVLYATLRHFPEIDSFAELSNRLTYVMQHAKSHGLDDVSSQAGNHVWMTAERLASFKPLNVTAHSTPNSEVHSQAIDPATLFERQEIHYFHLSSTLGPGSSPEIARLAMFTLLTSATLMKRNRPVYLLIDEFQRVAAHNVDTILQIARSMNVGVILANQSMTDLRQSHLDTVLESNCRYRQWYAISCPEEQHRLSKASGETIDILNSTTVSTTRDAGETRTTVGHTQSEYVAPRLTLNDVKLASDHPNQSIVLVNRGAGYSQFGGMPIVVESDFHISESEFLKRKHQPWPAGDPGTFVPATWTPQANPKSPPRRRKGSVPQITEETIGPTNPVTQPDLFDKFLSDRKSTGGK